jgi:wyosine [tRNA(Phe)-imidazoG37] synthetase (radical SAM superfamily)
MGKKSSYKYLFGPVPSRRLGSSLGVDTVPFKTCSYDCVYCQLGRTTDKICERRVFFPVEDILEECADKLKHVTRPNYITLSGSGEPTLHEKLGDIICGIKSITDIDVVVLTNGSLLWREEVKKSVLDADLLIPSLDAGDEKTFEQINRPHSEITFDKMVDGLCSLRKEFAGPIWLEVFLVNNVNTHKDQLVKIRTLADRIKPDRIQLNTAVRGSAEDFVEAISIEKMEEIQKITGPNSEIIVHGHQTGVSSEQKIKPEDVLDLLKRRPCSIDDLSVGLNSHRNEVIKHLHALQEQNIVSVRRIHESVLYEVRESNNNEQK